MGDGGRSGNLSELPGALARLWRGLACRVVWGGGEKDSPLPDYMAFLIYLKDISLLRQQNEKLPIRGIHP